MNYRRNGTNALLASAALLAGFALQACSDNGASGNLNIPPASPQALTTAQVLAIARTAPGARAPLTVNDGFITIVGSDETSDPLRIN
jgi:hypothetical protein